MDDHTFLLRMLEEMPRFVRASCGSLSSELALRTPACDKDFLLSHICHLTDCETELYGLRIRRILDESEPALEGLDVSKWPIEREYRSRSPDQSIELFLKARQDVVDLLKSLGHDDWLRTGIRFNGQRCDIREIVCDLIEHDQDHQWRIAAILREFATT
jgi:DinB superfamily